MDLSPVDLHRKSLVIMNGVENQGRIAQGDRLKQTRNTPGFHDRTHRALEYADENIIGTQAPTSSDDRYQNGPIVEKSCDPEYACQLQYADNMQNCTRSGIVKINQIVNPAHALAMKPQFSTAPGIYTQATTAAGNQMNEDMNNSVDNQVLSFEHTHLQDQQYNIAGYQLYPSIQDQHYNVMNMSYTEMLMSVDSPMTSQAILQMNEKSFQEPMGLENKTFMITGRNASQGSFEQDNDEEGYEQPVFGDEDVEDDTTHNFDDWECQDNDYQQDDVVMPEDKISDFVDPQGEGASTSKSDEAGNTDETRQNFEETIDIDVDGEVEQLTQEDIMKFIENEGMKAAQSCSEDVVSRFVPHKNQIFDSEAKAYAFYNDYAALCGFSVKKAGNYKGKDAGDEIGTRRTYTCNKSGKVVEQEVIDERKRKKKEREQQKSGSTEPKKTRKRRRNVLVITGCEAKMIVSLRDGKWVVTKLELQHNHELSPPDESKYLYSHKSMTDEEKLFIRTFTSVKLPTRKIMAILIYLRGGKPRNVPYTKKYVSNEMTKIRKENNNNDLMQVLSYFRNKQVEDPTFYYAFKLEEGNKTQCIFWADGYSRKMYDLYGDCLSFDTTYKTNKYNLPFAPFVGVSGHGHNCLFACAMIHNESVDTFKWLFETFLHCMGGKKPVTVITDQCVSTRNAVPAVFTNCKHRNCFFHIKRKAEEKCGRSFARIPNFHLDFSDILNNSLTTDEFETLWPEMIQRYNVGNLSYLKLMWEYRKKFVPVYFKQDFFPFIHSTARSEGTNAIYKDNVCSTFSVISFLGESEKITENIEELERNQDSVTRSTDPDYFARTKLELQAGKMYNRKIFYRFQKQIIFSAKLHVDEAEKGKTYSVYKTPMLELRDFRPRRYVVSVNLPAEDFVCICCKFQKDGIVCAHILRVLFHLNIAVLPEKYYIYRWKPKEKKDIRDKQFNIPIDLTTSNRHLRYTMLSRRLINIASEGSVADRQYLFVNENCKMVEDRLFEMAKEDELILNKNSKTVEPGPQSKAGPHPDGYGDFIQDPDVAPSTGRPKGNKRQKTFMENLFSKQQITCSHCGSNDHNIATCTNLNLDKAVFEKKAAKKKKQPGEKTAGKQDKKPADKKVQSGSKQAKARDQGGAISQKHHADPQSKKSL